MDSIACTHIQEGKPSDVFHDTREYPTVNSIFSTENNEVSSNGEDALKCYQYELKNRIYSYTQRTMQKIQKNTITCLSAIVNLLEHHCIEDLTPLVNHLENTLDTKVFMVAVHKDEGFEDEEGNRKVNYHGHIEMLGIDSDGNSIRKKLTRSYLCDLQTKNAEFLGMERGKRNSKKKRLGTYQFKESMKRFDTERKEYLAREKMLENELNITTEKLQISLENEETFNDKISTLSNSLISNANKVIKKKDNEAKMFQTKYKKTEKVHSQLKKDAGKLVNFIKSVSRIFDCEVNDFDQLGQLYDDILMAQKLAILNTDLLAANNDDVDPLKHK